MRADKDERTFETRLLFIKGVFEDLHSQSDIMAKCVSYKLRGSLENYMADLERSYGVLMNKNPVSVLKKID